MPGLPHALVGFFVVLLLALPPGLRGADRQRFNALQTKAVNLARQGKVGASVPYWEEMVRLQPYNEGALYRLALAHLHRKDVGGEQYREGCRRAVGLLRQAVTMQQRVSVRGPELGLRFLYLGLALWYSGEAEQAESAFLNAYRADFERRDAVYNRFAVLSEAGKHAEARVVEQEYLRISKDTSLDD